MYSKSCSFVKKTNYIILWDVHESRAAFCNSLVVQKKVWPWSTFSIRIDIVTARKGQTPCHIFQEKDTEDTLFKIPKNVDRVKYIPVFLIHSFQFFKLSWNSCYQSSVNVEIMDFHENLSNLSPFKSKTRSIFCPTYNNIFIC